MLAACRGAAETAGIDYARLVYPYLEKEMSLADRGALDLRDRIRIALEFPSYGWRRVTAELHRQD